MKYSLDPIAQEALEFLKVELGADAVALAQESLGIPLLAEAERIPLLWASLEGALELSEKKQFLIFFVNQRQEDEESTTASNLKCLDFLGSAIRESFTLGKIKGHPFIVLNGSLPRFFLNKKDAWGGPER